MSEHGNLVDALITQFQTDVSGATNWRFFTYEPVQHQGAGQNCAVWFAGEAPAAEFATAGSHDMVEEYHVRYWEPAPEKATGLVVDEAAAEAVETLYDDLKASVYAHQAVSTSYQVWFAGGQMLVGGDVEGKIRGFEVVISARRVVAFT